MKISRGLSAVVLAGALSVTVCAQSLGDTARQARAEKPATPQTKVYTNDNLPTTGSISVLGSAPAAPAAPGASNDGKATKPAGAAAASPSEAEAKQQAADKTKADVEAQKGEISRLERE